MNTKTDTMPTAPNSSTPINAIIDWSQIDTILLDMDGTLLDLSFDNFFWFEYLPKRFCDIHGKELREVKTMMREKITHTKGSQQWYDFNYWSAQFNIDVLGIHKEVEDHIALLPNTLRFLEYTKTLDKELVIVTNAFPDTVTAKLAQTGIEPYFSNVISAFKYGAPKEDTRFWQSLEQDLGYDPNRTLFVDDNACVLDCAKQAHIKFVLGVTENCANRELSNISEKDSPAKDLYKTLDRHITLPHLGKLII